MALKKVKYAFLVLATQPANVRLLIWVTVTHVQSVAGIKKTGNMWRAAVS